MKYRPPLLRFSGRLPAASRFGNDCLLISDRSLPRRIPGFRDWASSFPASYSVQAGEKLKDIRTFASHLSSILKLTSKFAPGKTTIVVAGGGSVGDFGGFVASILKRGVRLVHVPSTWLAALDSSHGGKTALNVDGIKNQVGTFHQASEVHLVRELLIAQPEVRAEEAYGELVKIALIDGKPWCVQLENSISGGAAKPETLWNFLKPAIEAKYRVVARDPFEKNGVRQILNLGHTLGHALEAHHRLPHGVAVAQGLLFAVAWSRHKGLLVERKSKRAIEVRFRIKDLRSIQGALPKMPRADFTRLLHGDKKRTSASLVNFIFLRGEGKPVILPVAYPEMIAEATRQGWIQ